ncbi:hypothetical protein [Aquitalea magnusonii]|uniref:hypothetical protein n=1 Tax=Aquitalea magnusonii TaxID=332411 RepID=UPI00128F41A4|nr:hypothetical protein [Aquitalea magnusonii]
MTLQEFFNRYSQAYSALDARAVSALFTRPFTAVHHGQIATFGINDEEMLYQTTAAFSPTTAPRASPAPAAIWPKYCPLAASWPQSRYAGPPTATRPSRGCSPPATT